MAKKAKKLRTSEGVLAMSALRQGKCLPENTVKKVTDFYKDDINS